MMKKFLLRSPTAKKRQLENKASSDSLTSQDGSAGSVFGASLEDFELTEEGIPFCVELLCAQIKKRGLKAEWIFRVAGTQKTVDVLRSALDNDALDVHTLDRCDDIHAVAGVLKGFLRHLATPVVPIHFNEEFARAHSAYKEDVEEWIAAMASILLSLPQPHFHLVAYLLTFLEEVAHHESANKMGPKAIGIIFGPNLFRTEGSVEGLRDQNELNDVTSLLIKHRAALFTAVSHLAIEQTNANESARNVDYDAAGDSTAPIGKVSSRVGSAHMQRLNGQLLAKQRAAFIVGTTDSSSPPSHAHQQQGALLQHNGGSLMPRAPPRKMRQMGGICVLPADDVEKSRSAPAIALGQAGLRSHAQGFGDGESSYAVGAEPEALETAEELDFAEKRRLFDRGVPNARTPVDVAPARMAIIATKESRRHGVTSEIYSAPLRPGHERLVLRTGESRLSPRGSITSSSTSADGHTISSVSDQLDSSQLTVALSSNADDTPATLTRDALASSAQSLPVSAFHAPIATASSSVAQRGVAPEVTHDYSVRGNTSNNSTQQQPVSRSQSATFSPSAAAHSIPVPAGASSSSSEGFTSSSFGGSGAIDEATERSSSVGGDLLNTTDAALCSSPVQSLIEHHIASMLFPGAPGGESPGHNAPQIGSSSSHSQETPIPSDDDTLIHAAEQVAAGSSGKSAAKYDDEFTGITPSHSSEFALMARPSQNRAGATTSPQRHVRSNPIMDDDDDIVIADQTRDSKYPVAAPSGYGGRAAVSAGVDVSDSELQSFDELSRNASRPLQNTNMYRSSGPRNRRAPSSFSTTDISQDQTAAIASSQAKHRVTPARTASQMNAAPEPVHLVPKLNLSQLDGVSPPPPAHPQQPYVAHQPQQRPSDLSKGARPTISAAEIKKMLMHANALKREIRGYEEQFASRNEGRRPSARERNQDPEIRHMVSEFQRLKLSVRQAKATLASPTSPASPAEAERPSSPPPGEQQRPSSGDVADGRLPSVSSTVTDRESSAVRVPSQFRDDPLTLAPYPYSTADSSTPREDSLADGGISQAPHTQEETRDRIMQSLDRQRNDVGRPFDVQLMSDADIRQEKICLQKALLHYENLHGRPDTPSTKALMRSLYDRYRIVKRRLARIQVVTANGAPEGSVDMGSVRPSAERLPAPAQAPSNADRASPGLHTTAALMDSNLYSPAPLSSTMPPASATSAHTPSSRFAAQKGNLAVAFPFDLAAVNSQSQQPQAFPTSVQNVSVVNESSGAHAQHHAYQGGAHHQQQYPASAKREPVTPGMSASYSAGAPSSAGGPYHPHAHNTSVTNSRSGYAVAASTLAASNVYSPPPQQPPPPHQPSTYQQAARIPTEQPDIASLEHELDVLREEKRHLRRELKRFEDAFLAGQASTGEAPRKIDRAARAPKLQQYKRYKRLKQEIAEICRVLGYSMAGEEGGGAGNTADDPYDSN